jgi:acyl dehydratase
MTDEVPSSAWTGTANGRPVLGSVAERQRTTTAEDIVAFSAMSGDYNPLHYDEEMARKSVFGRLIVQGGVTTALLNATVAQELPGPGTVFLGVEWKFVKAVGIGERLTARVEVLSVRDDKPICTLSTTIFNEHGEACLTGTATTYTVGMT